MRRNWLLLLLVLVLTGCSGNKFKMQIELPANVTATYRMLYFASTKKHSKVVESTIAVTAGKALQTFPTGSVSVAYLFTSSSESPAIVIYIEKGDNIKIAGKSSDPLEWSVEGNDVNEQLSAWRKQNLNVLRSRNPKDINAAVAAEVKKHPKNEASTILMLTAFDRSLEPELYIKLWNSLDKKARPEKLIEAIGRFDQLTPDNASPNLPDVGELEVLLLKDSMMRNLKSSDVDVSLFYFWGMTDDHQLHSMVDSLNMLHKELPDSTVRIIDISLVNDSTTWRYRTETDTARYTGRAWMPAGLMNNYVEAIRIQSLPALVVIDKKGKQKYQGNNYQQARQAVLKARAAKPTAPAKKKPEENKIKKPTD